MINVNISNCPISAGKELGSGKPHFRFQFQRIDGVLLFPSIREEKIRLLSQKFLKNRPGFDLLDFLGLRRRVILQVEDQNGTSGYIAIHAESLRKRLSIEKGQFYQVLKNNKGEMTQFLERTLRKKVSFRVYEEGSKYLRGSEQVEKDPDKALRIFKDLIDCGSPLGYVGLAEYYSKGEGVAQDSSAAKQTIQKMFKASGDGNIARYLSLLVNRGVKEVEPFIGESFIAQRTLAICYIQGKDGWQKNPEKGFQLLQKIYPKDPWTSAHLVRCYLQGLGTDKDPEKAKHLILEGLKVWNEYQTDTFFIDCNRFGIEEFDELCSKNIEIALKNIRANFQFYSFCEEFFKFLEKFKLFPEVLGLIAYCYVTGTGMGKNPYKALDVLTKMRERLEGEDRSRCEKCMQLFLRGPAYLIDS